MSSLYELLISFLQIGLFSIGGGYATIPLIQEQVVNLHGWLTMQEFTDIITISQMTPGPIAVNTSTFVGIQIAGIPGAIVATIGCIFSGFVISITLYKFFQKYQSSIYVYKVINGLKASACGLIMACAGTILLLAFCNTSTLTIKDMSLDGIAVLIFCICFLLLRKFKWNPILVIVSSGIMGLVLYL
ncbi:chromate transporter [Amedibacillus sp. YH-ame6]